MEEKALRAAPKSVMLSPNPSVFMLEKTTSFFVAEIEIAFPMMLWLNARQSFSLKRAFRL